MSTSQSDPAITSPVVQKKPRHVPRRVPLSCEPCRRHKLKCDRGIPCSTCSRYNREELCLLNPAAPGGKKTGSSQPRQNDQSRPGRIVEATDASQPVAAAAGERSSRQGAGNPSGNGWSAALSHDSVADVPATQQQRRGRGQLVESVNVVAATKSLSARRQHPSSAGDAGTDGRSEGAMSILFPQTLPLLQFSSGHDGSILETLMFADDELQWKRLLVKLLPTRTQSDILLSYFIEHINWLFQTVHIPTFRKEYATFWDGAVEDADLPWMSLLFTILSLSALYIPVDVVQVVGLQRESIRRYSHVWHRACLQALQAGNYERKPTLSQLQTFSVTQLYWYATNDIETINSRMGQAIRNAQALGLDKDRTPSRNIGDEMRHRLWWDLVDSDTFQSICLDRPPLIQAHLAHVPLPLNCNDLDLGADFAHAKPVDEPTTMSMNIYRAKIFQLINRALVTDPSQLQSYSAVVDIDQQLVKTMDELPWYFQLDHGGKAKTFAAAHDFLTWQNHILRTCVSTQRIRMYRPFLDNVTSAFDTCIGAVEDALTVYRALRDNKPIGTQQKFFPQAYQIFSVAVTLAALLLVERTIPNAARFRVDIQSMAADLGLLEAQACPVPVAVNGRNVLLEMISLFEQDDSCSPQDAERLVPDISIILGGENTTRAYLGRRTAAETPHHRRTQTQPGDDIGLGGVDEQIQGSEITTGQLTNTQLIDHDLSLTPLIGGGANGLFDLDDFHLGDSYGLFNWDMTGLLSDALANGRQ
ncbi:uncharacterized protein Z520_01090 [Fonsecaea multimorphosa CBS 102226]|uniref:Zn(2)-C6 fungal-type domain-containing protein n=1 Tax=Fonsecaea multimorphosa CBS 102226 TaxID=1442371 RepID=A0A0D2KGN9_9EURO|nr:uncharacterized protein Z520_01090 [Fonsecaea multimorphosa CBS 102226]KIY02625.1 hypothetical protein Z520_01090 [Fonsecaea multimorphosa CBS 102226]